MHRALLKSVFALIIVAVFSTCVFAENNYFTTGMAQFQAQDFKNAKLSLENAVESGTLSKDELVKAHEELAIIEISVGNEDIAQEHIAKIFQIKPLYSLPVNASPSFRKVFDKVRNEIDRHNYKISKLSSKGKKERLAGIILTSVGCGAAVGMAALYISSANEVKSNPSKARSKMWLQPTTTTTMVIVLPLMLIPGISLWVIGQDDIDQVKMEPYKASWLQDRNPALLYSFDPETDTKTVGVGFLW